MPSLSHPAAPHVSDEPAPSDRAERGYVCLKCRRRFDEKPGLQACPDDQTLLLRVADLAAAPGDTMLGRVLASRFTILARLGAGSMGTVYRAKQAPIGRDVAIKILRSDRAVDEVSRARFLREARANSVLKSPNTVTVFDFGQSEGGEFYLAMELLEGESLGQRLKRVGRLSADEAIETAKQALRSLAEAHAKGVIHRDLKPDNLFYARVRTNETFEEIVKVLDFGIAKMLHAEGELAMNAIETQVGTVFGTPRYMSPEQAQGKLLDPRSDLYSLGVILYHMLTGRAPFTDDDAIVVMARHIKTLPRPMSDVAPEAQIPPDLEDLVMRLLSKEPEKRPQMADVLIAELTRAKESAAAASGARPSIPGEAEAAFHRTKSMATASALTYDTLSVPPGVPSSSRRRVMTAGAVGVLAMLATAAIASEFRRTPSRPPVTTADVASPQPSPTAIVAEPPVMLRSSAPAQPSAAPPASVGTGLDVSRSEPRPSERRIPHPTHAPSAAQRPVGTPTVGYGYLE